MRIAISCRSLEYASGGVKEYLVSLLNALLAIDTRNTYVLFHSQVSFFGSFPGAEEIALHSSNRLVFDWLKLPGAMSRQGIDLAFFPSSNMPRRISCPAVAAMMDLGYFYPGKRMYRLLDTLYMKRAMAYTARRAQALLAISEHTKKDLMTILGVPEDKITVTPLAADDIYRAPVPEDEVLRFKQRHGLTRPFFLYTGNISPRKNLRGLLMALAAVRDVIPTELVVTGGLSWNDDFAKWVRKLGLTERVHRLGYVERRDMPVLYKASQAFVFPSFFEGFGLPVLEAQALGVPVVCSTAASLPEVAGNSALMVHPADTPGLGQALVNVATDRALRQDLITKGLANVDRFSWRATAEKTLDVFERTARK